MSRCAVRLVMSALVLLACASSAQAQIDAWRDANGTLVLSHRPPLPALQTGAGSRTVHVASPPLPLQQSDYDDLIDLHAQTHQVRADLVRAVIQVESAFNPRARSPKGAMGLMQLMPATAAELGVTDPYDPAENIRGGVAYLKQLLARYQDDETLALAAYNAGPSAVDRYGQRVPPYPETRDYVSRIHSAAPARLAVATTGSVLTPPPATRIYRGVDSVGGSTIRLYTNVRPRSGAYEVLPARY